MENQENIYFRTGGRLTHAGCEMLPNGNDIPRIIIERIEYKDTESINGRTEIGVWLAHFAPNNGYTTLPMILNATNRKRLVKLFPQCEGYIARLHNVAVRMTKEKCRDVQDGGETFGLRISKMPAAPAPAPAAKKAIGVDAVEKVVSWANKNNKTIEDIKATYVVSAEVEKAIVEALKK